MAIAIAVVVIADVVATAVTIKYIMCSNTVNTLVNKVQTGLHITHGK